MTMAKVFTPLFRDGIDPESKTISLEDFLSWLVDRAEDNSCIGSNSKISMEEAMKRKELIQSQDIVLKTIDEFLNYRTALGLSS